MFFVHLSYQSTICSFSRTLSSFPRIKNLKLKGAEHDSGEFDLQKTIFKATLIILENHMEELLWTALL